MSRVIDYVGLADFPIGDTLFVISVQAKRRLMTN